MNAKLQLGLLEHLSVDTHFAMMLVRWRSPAHDMLLSTEMPVPLVCAVSAAMAEVMAWGKRAVGPVNFPRSSQKRVSLIGGKCGCRVSETDVMVSAKGVGGLRPVTPGMFIFLSCAKSRLPSSRVAVSLRWESWAPRDGCASLLVMKGDEFRREICLPSKVSIKLMMEDERFACGITRTTCSSASSHHLLRRRISGTAQPAVATSENE